MEQITDQLYQNKTQYKDIEQFLESTLICGYCADKLRSNKEVAGSCFNHLAVIPTPDCIKDLNIFERSLIKFCMTCITVVRLGQITNSKRPQNELTAATSSSSDSSYISFIFLSDTANTTSLVYTCLGLHEERPPRADGGEV